MSKPNSDDLVDVLDNLFKKYRDMPQNQQTEANYADLVVEATHSLNELYLKKYLELLGKQRPYKDGNYSYWCGEKDLRQELREEATKRFRNV